MKIETKFNIGDEIWTILEAGKTLSKFQIALINICRDGVSYRPTKVVHGYGAFAECDCFASLAEAEKSLTKNGE